MPKVAQTGGQSRCHWSYDAVGLSMTMAAEDHVNLTGRKNSNAIVSGLCKFSEGLSIHRRLTIPRSHNVTCLVIRSCLAFSQNIPDHSTDPQ